MSSKKVNKKTRLFVSDLKSLLYAFGDSPAPNVETIHALEDVLTSYLIDVITSANIARQIHGRHKLEIEDLKFALRKDPVKLGRVDELFKMDKEIAKAKKMFDDVDKGSKRNAAAANFDGENGGLTGNGKQRKKQKKQKKQKKL
ncbi:unnamed protein product [Ambrosiozyma monospora]|uniref:Unnamed protein product n=1 Tax=Ambrosiozyma monospora TaxID=43982 RepID=A0ACB5TSL5_AMBMO|nr:unnamed protein product [Ambrosiozyma monospora]